MELFSALLAFYAGNSPVTGKFPSKRPVAWSFDVFFDLRLNKRLSNNREAGDLRRHSAPYDATVMIMDWCKIISEYRTHSALAFCLSLLLFLHQESFR